MLIFIITFVVVFHFDSEISKKVVDVRVCDSQQKDLQNKVEGCMADLSETHGEVYQLNLVKTAASGTIACLENEVEDYKTRLSEKVGKYNHLQDEFRKKWQEKEQLEQENKEKIKAVDDLKAKLSEMQNERDCAKADYGKEKQENEKCKLELHSESEIVQAQKKTIHDLSVKLQGAEKRFHDQKKEDSNEGSIAIGVIVIGGIIACIAFCGPNSK